MAATRLTRIAPQRSTALRFPTGENHMSEQDRQQRLEQLEAKLAAAKQAQEPAPRQEEHYSQAQHAWRMVIELVAGLGIGFGMGCGLDWLFGTLPIFMLIFTCLGLVAGVKTMIRSAREFQDRQIALMGKDKTQPLGDENDTGDARTDEGA